MDVETSIEELSLFSILPKELILKIMSFCHPDFLLTTSTVSTEWTELLHNQDFWFRLLGRANLRASQNKDWRAFFRANTTIAWDTTILPQQLKYPKNNLVQKLADHPDISTAFSSTALEQGCRLITFNVYRKTDELLLGLTDDIECLAKASAHEYTLHENTWALFDGSRYRILQTGGTAIKNSLSYGTGDCVELLVDCDTHELSFTVKDMTSHEVKGEIRYKGLPDKPLWCFAMLDVRGDSIEIQDITKSRIYGERSYEMIDVDDIEIEAEELDTSFPTHLPGSCATS